MDLYWVSCNEDQNISLSPYLSISLPLYLSTSLSLYLSLCPPSPEGPVIEENHSWQNNFNPGYSQNPNPASTFELSLSLPPCRRCKEGLPGPRRGFWVPSGSLSPKTAAAICTTKKFQPRCWKMFLGINFRKITDFIAGLLAGQITGISRKVTNSSKNILKITGHALSRINSVVISARTVFYQEWFSSITGPVYSKVLDRKMKSTIGRSKRSPPKAAIKIFHSLGPLVGDGKST